MLDNKQLANELLVRCAGFASPYRGMIQEAARRLLQMVPDEKTMAGAQEAKSLRWLANEFPLIENPADVIDKMSNCIHLYCTSAADRIEQMAETIAYARQIQAERDAMAAALKKAHGCDGCAHRNCDFDKDPCVSCLKDGNYSKWTWKGANHG